MAKENKSKGNVPNLRFPGFEEEWKEVRLGEIATFQSGYAFKSEHFSEEGIKLVTPKNFTKNGYGNFESSISKCSVEKPPKNFLCSKDDLLILLTDLTPSCELLGKPLLVQQEDGEIWLNQRIVRLDFSTNVSKHWILQFLQTDRYHKVIKETATGSTVRHSSNKIIENINLQIPNLNEQDKIASFFSLIDLRIQTQNKIIEELNVLKTTITKRIFSCQLRFKNARGDNYEDWKTKKLGDVTTLINKRNKNNEKLPVYSINNKLGFVPQSEQFEGVDSEDRGYDITLYKIIDKNTFAYNPARINVGSIGYSGNLENIIISSLYVCFKTEEFVNDNFLFQYLKTDFFNKEVLRNVEGGVRDYLFYENFARIKFDLPCVEEQRKIANYLLSIDMKIDIETQFLNKLEEQKKFLLQQMFV
ncbi:restriction endonuclease subunit S [Flavobacterium beibuense]|uniref:Restriction modification system DNA specificity domain protein n=1 Tax=Flavobacterium beibuense TaxID=657326 RepID=A0A444WHV0_9FLAO|nr:restriction endonuclease subunit S [Flavobacterium beibuense]RYJ45438.1 Restriction modification system DNA specificity domain protein [Flavobacterium beibuense]